MKVDFAVLNGAENMERIKNHTGEWYWVRDGNEMTLRLSSGEIIEGCNVPSAIQWDSVVENLPRVFVETGKWVDGLWYPQVKQENK